MSTTQPPSATFTETPVTTDTAGSRPLALVTGASSGIGYHLAECCARAGMDLLIVADEPKIHTAATSLGEEGIAVEAVEADLSTRAGVDQFIAAIRGRPVSVLCANAGRGLGRAFLDQDFSDIARVIETNVTGTVYLLHHVGRAMRTQGSGRILITGSIAGLMPGTYQAVYNASKSFLDSLSFALRHELRDSGVSVTCLMPGATETEFFERADMLDTRVAQGKKDDPADVARQGFEAMMRNDGDVVTGWQNKLRAAIANVTPADTLAEQHRRMAEPLSEPRES
ncbi:SDR family NAD(P)-dependent oxidoreductase [Cupriavidus plantarum]|uniref:SDR family NAD(P)-dependent oxidoreductase n=1 Tax=Cupriavidus plantarum TaxID=942865 RepID=UPI000EB5976A|nr:SDR family NAD(P)-dependent oxidoreductase [Cupriavidus plantarum]RLK45191.1 short-subunit dehydrogenase [Cupriavidus plantarum]